MNLYLDALYLTPYLLDCWFDCLALWFLTPEPEYNIEIDDLWRLQILDAFFLEFGASHESV